MGFWLGELRGTTNPCSRNPGKPFSATLGSSWMCDPELCPARREFWSLGHSWKSPKVWHWSPRYGCTPDARINEDRRHLLAIK